MYSGWYMLTIQHRQTLRDTMGIVWFVVAVIIGAWLINALVFRSFSVTGPSMESTMYTGDRLIVNRLPMTWAALRGQSLCHRADMSSYFRNPKFEEMKADEFVVKRGLRYRVNTLRSLVAKLPSITTNDQTGSTPMRGVRVYASPVTGRLDKTVVPDGSIFVIGDNRGGNESLDSRNGFGFIPLDNIVGPVVIRIYPFSKISTNF